MLFAWFCTESKCSDDYLHRNEHQSGVKQKKKKERKNEKGIKKKKSYSLRNIHHSKLPSMWNIKSCVTSSFFFNVIVRFTSCLPFLLYAMLDFQSSVASFASREEWEWGEKTSYCLPIALNAFKSIKTVHSHRSLTFFFFFFTFFFVCRFCSENCTPFVCVLSALYVDTC